MKNLIIIGAGGLGRQMYAWIKECPGYKVDYAVGGFLDDNPGALDGFHNYPPVISSLDKYKIQENDVFTLAIGDVETKKRIAQIIESKGGEFITIIHPDSLVYQNTQIGKGCFITPWANIGVDVSIGDFCLIQGNALIGHDVKIGNYVRIDCNVVCVGGIEIKDDVCVHTSAVINHNVVIEEGATVGAMSFVIKRVKKGTTVFGNPAKKVEF